MLFNSFVFFFFLAACFGVYRQLRDRKARSIFLLAASYLFYSYWDWRFTILLAVSTVTDYLVGLKLGGTEDKRKRKHLLFTSIVVNLGILGFFKYFNFFVDSARGLVGPLGLDLDALHLKLILPVGISFYTFKTLSYSIDVFRRKVVPTRSLVDYALFVAFFPNLVAGPIERAGRLLPQLANLHAPSKQEVSEGFTLISLGLFKKILIGDAAARIVNNIFGQPDLYRSPEIVASLVLFSIQVYADFAGYSNIASGVARLFGIELVKNFDQPYLSRSFSEFWRRWHISLSTWIWDYIFNPLLSAILRRLARLKLSDIKLEMRLAYPLAAMVTMLLCGLWHGAGTTFIIWGGLHGLFLSVERLFVYGNRAIPMRKRIKNARGVVRFLATWGSTQFLVVFAWLFFRAKDLGQVRDIIGRIVHWQSSELTGRFVVITLAFSAMVFLLDIIEYTTRSELWMLRLRPELRRGIFSAAILVVIFYLATNKPLPFVYFQF